MKTGYPASEKMRNCDDYDMKRFRFTFDTRPQGLLMKLRDAQFREAVCKQIVADPELTRGPRDLNGSLWLIVFRLASFGQISDPT